MKKNPSEQNKLFYGDNLDILRKYIRDETVDLAYIDPPFNSKRNYNQIYNNIGKEDKAQAQAFIDTWTWDDEAIEGLEEIIGNYNGLFSKQTIQLILGLEKVLGRGSLLAYLINMTLRIVEIHRVLKKTGTFYLHCDPTSSHYLKLVLDAVFCSKGGDFQNEIIWCYTAPTNTRNSFPKKHDVIFRYTKSNEWVFNYEEISIPYSDETVARTNRGSGNQGLYKGVNPEEKHANRLKPKGKIPEDWWVLPRLQGNSIERLGYPTQKPETLLDRIIRVSSNKGDLVLDAFCGCGTTVSVAEKRGRRWIGIDITYQSISLIMKRMSDSYGQSILNNIELNGVPHDIESAIALANKKEDKLRKEFEKWSVLAFTENRGIINDKKGADGGIDGRAYISDYDKEGIEIELKEVIFSVKSDKKPSVSYIRELLGTIESNNAVMGYLILLHPPTKDMLEEAKKIGKYKNKLFDKSYDKIKIIMAEEIINGITFDVPRTQEIKVVKSAQLKENLDNPTLF